MNFLNIFSIEKKSYTVYNHPMYHYPDQIFRTFSPPLDFMECDKLCKSRGLGEISRTLSTKSYNCIIFIIMASPSTMGGNVALPFLTVAYRPSSYLISTSDLSRTLLRINGNPSNI